MRIAVIGAGAFGLSAARYLERAGLEVTVFEAAAFAGGAAHSRRDGEWLTEYGPNTLAAGADTVALLGELGVAGVVEASAEASKRFLVKDGKPVALPMKPPHLLKSGLFSMRAKLALLREPLVKRKTDEVEESVADFVRRRLSDEWLATAVGPFISGVYAGDPEHLSLRYALPRMYNLEQEHGGLIRGAVKLRSLGGRKLYGAPEGMSQIMARLAAPLADLRLETPVQGVIRSGENWMVRTAAEEALFERVVLALPARAAADLLEPMDAEVADTLRVVDYPPLVVVHHGYRRVDVTHPLDGFGMLIPREESFRTLGVLFPSTMFAGRAPENHVLLTSFVGGALDRGVARVPIEDITATVEAEHMRLLGLRGSPVWTHAYCVRHAIPQYNMGYGSILADLQAAEQRHPGLYLRGNYVGGIALPDRLHGGKALAEEFAS
jgi:protoporphyrinogen/coproporphyrinogen III oxidase